jgi:hypothetical protein
VLTQGKSPNLISIAQVKKNKKTKLEKRKKEMMISC